MSYLTLNHAERAQYTDATVAILKNSGLEFDSIVCSGLSGVLVAPEVAHQLGKNIVNQWVGHNKRK